MEERRNNYLLLMLSACIFTILLVIGLMPLMMIASGSDSITTGGTEFTIDIPPVSEGMPVGTVATWEGDPDDPGMLLGGGLVGGPAEVRELWRSKGHVYDDLGFCTIDGRIIIAAKPRFGEDGDWITWYFDDGSKLETIKGDDKGADATNEWGHVTSGQVGVLEFWGSRKVGDNPYTTLQDHGRIGRRVVRAVNHGSLTHPERNTNGSGSTSTGGGSIVDGSLSSSQKAVVRSCSNVGSPGTGLCAMWVSMVFADAGQGYPGGDACDMYDAWCTSSNMSDLKPGMIIAVRTHDKTSAGRIYGHVGIYVGNGQVMDNIGSIRTIPVNDWIDFYGGSSTPKWGWAMGKNLSR